MSEDKLSQEELRTEFQRIFARWGGLVGKEMQAYEQIKSLLTPIPKEKLDDFLEEKAQEWGYFSPRQKTIVKGFMLQMLKEHEALKGEGGG